MRHFLLLLTLISGITTAQELPLIPRPVRTEYGSGTFTINSNTQIVSPVTFEAEYLKQAIKSQTGLDLKIVGTAKDRENCIVLSVEIGNTPDEHYTLSVSQNSAQIKASHPAGLFYGIQTFIQSIPFKKFNSVKMSVLTITDSPKYAWRGMHLDVSRHFFPVEFVKKYIDNMARYKLNTFHWHLTDDQGWRIEIKKYPKLTSVGGWRNGSMVGHYSEQKFDTIRHGGFYTQEQIKEIVEYAKKRHITVVPEIEMPGHAVAALAAYPEFSCTGGPFEVAKIWGVLDDVFCPKEETFTFLENVLSEVISLFPSQYIHVGGDECPKIRWKNCPHCQKLIADKNLGDEHGLQSYFVQRIEKFVNSKGRQIIGWDEILEGGLAPNAAVMSWRGTDGGITAAKQKHNVVMSPGSHCYFDHYQGDPKFEPIAFGGFTPLEEVYGFNPTPERLSSDETKYILGAQANLWTEYIDNWKQVEYMTHPRIAALSEVLWGTADAANYENFKNRVISHFDIYEAIGLNYAKNIYDIRPSVYANPDGGIFYKLESIDGKGIRYSTNGNRPTENSTLYNSPISVTKSQVISAAYFENGRQKGNPVSQAFTISKSTGRPIVLATEPHQNYNFGGAFSLVDGQEGNPTRFGRDWLGFSGSDLKATINLNSTLSEVRINFLESPGSWIYFPKYVRIESGENGNFKTIATASADDIRKANGRLTIAVKSIPVKQLRITATNAGIIPEGNPGAGSPAWLFADEIHAN